MSDSLSTKNLIACIQEKEKYKGTLIYLQEAHKFNEKVYDIFNEALETVFLAKHNNYMAKLLSLRLFKEIVLTGNFTLIDGLNEKIEEEIVKIIQYNKQSKEINRGANYFIEVEKQKKDGEIQKVGSSYVLLASEIIMALAKWYPVDEDGVKSRFSEWYEKLVASGVPFHEFNFFKKEDEEKFKKNYQKWIKWYLEEVKEQEVEETSKQIKIEQIPNNTNQNQKRQQIKNEANIKVGVVIETQKTPELVQSVIRQEAPQHNYEKVQEKIIQPQPKRTILANSNSLQLSKSFEDRIKIIQGDLERTNKQKNILKQRYDKDITLLKVAKAQAENKLKDSQRLLLESQAQYLNIKQQLKQKENSIAELQNLANSLRQSIAHLQKQETNKIISQQAYQPVEAEYYNIKLTPPRQYEQLQQQNDILNEALENAEKHFLAMKKALEGQLTLFKEQNKKLKAELDLKTQQLQDQRSKKSVGQELIRNIIRQDSLLIEDQPKMLCKAKINNTLNQYGQYSKPSIKNCSVSEYLRTNSKMKVSQNIEPAAQARPRSLKKTESQHRLKGYNEVQGFSKTGFSNENKAVGSKLVKTSNNFNNRLNLDHNNNVITYFPFLQDYFQPLPEANPFFKKHCLKLQPDKGQFFQNQLIKASISKGSQLCWLLNVLNKSSGEIKIKILPGHYSLNIEGQKSKKIRHGEVCTFTIKFDKLDLNLRYPIVSIVIGNQRISITNCNPHEKDIHLPLPLTLLDFCTVNKEKNREWVSDDKITKYCSDRLPVTRLGCGIHDSFPSFKTSFNSEGVVARAGLELLGMEDGRVLVQIQQKQDDFKVIVCFRSDSSNGSNLAKVIMQILLYLIQK